MNNIKQKLIVGGIATLALISSSAAIVSAENGNQNGNLRGWVKSGTTVKYVDANDANTNVDINKNGIVTIRGAKIVSIGSSTITVNSVLGTANLTWTVNYDSATSLQAKNGKTILVGDMAVGDVVTVKGQMLSGSALALKANLIRDISKSITPVVINARQIFEGTLSVLPGASFPTSITMMIGSTPLVVNLSGSTVLLNNVWAPVSLSYFQAGDNVRVFGFIPTGSTTVTGIVLRNATR